MTARQPPGEKGAKACTIGLYQSRDWAGRGGLPGLSGGGALDLLETAGPAPGAGGKQAPPRAAGPAECQRGGPSAAGRGGQAGRLPVPSGAFSRRADGDPLQSQDEQALHQRAVPVRPLVQLPDARRRRYLRGAPGSDPQRDRPARGPQSLLSADAQRKSPVLAGGDGSKRVNGRPGRTK